MTELIVAGYLLVLANVTVCGELVVPASCEAKVRLAGEIESVGGGAVAVPLSVTV